VSFVTSTASATLRCVNGGGTDRGAVYVIFLGPNGGFQSYKEINSATPGFDDIANGDRFGSGIACLGDLNGDLITDVAVGASLDAGSGTRRGAVWTFGIEADGTVPISSIHEIDDSDLVLGSTFGDNDHFGTAIAGLGDINGVQIPDMAVSANLGDAGGTDTGSVWIIFMNSDGSPKEFNLIADGNGGLPNGIIDLNDNFGVSLARLEDLNGDGLTDLACGAHYDDDGFTNAGAMYILFLDSDGMVRGHQKISVTEGNFSNHNNYLVEDDEFGGGSASALVDMDNDGRYELFVGAAQDDDGGSSSTAERGAIYVLDLEPCSSPYIQTPSSGIAGELNTLLVTFAGANNIVWFA